MFAGMIAPEKPPLRMANKTSSIDSLRTLKFGPSVRSACPTLLAPAGREPRVPAASRVWQPPQRSLKITAPSRTAPADFGTWISRPHPAASAARAAAQATKAGFGRVTGAHNIRRPVRRPLSLVTVAVLLAGCGGAKHKSHRAITGKPGQAVRVAADEYSFDPSKIVLESGPLTVELKNDGVLAHNLRVLRDGQDVGGTETFQGGATRSATVQLAPGSYQFQCSVGNHAQLGMTGEIEVRGGPAGRSPDGPAEQ